MAKAKTTEKRRRLEAQEHGGVLVRGGTPGIGRPKEVLRRACREAFTDKAGVAFVAGVMAGEVTESVTVTVGSGKDAHAEVVQVPPKIRDRLYAPELLMDRGYGKPDQALQVEDDRPVLTEQERVARILELLPRVLATLPIDRQELVRRLQERHRIEVLMSGKQVKDGRNGNGDGPAA